ncbi:radical SAM superfamily protein [Artemisia annua]|uniref:Radical SAM superfamily protein n=1 Tax=Artemisia annua TaxID=35608 RepID=A0A2U1PPN0_ARTAN|nr:radical SAM superfamily protein [Artemisia annua]
MAYQPHPQPKKNPLPVKKDNPKKDQGCHYCNVVGYWKRNCPLYLDEFRANRIKKTGHVGASTSENKWLVVKLVTENNCEVHTRRVPIPSDTQSVKFYRMASKILGEANYNHYEVSSYSKDGSARYINGTRYSRPKKLKDYTNHVQNLEAGLVDWGQDDDEVDEQEMAMDIVMLSLRTSKGLDLKSFIEDFGSEVAVELCKVYEPYMKSGHVLFLDDQRRELRKMSLVL